MRKAFLCGTDDSGRSFEHRRRWIEQLIVDQAQIYAIDITAYAVMSNHVHVVLHINKEQADAWSHRDVIKRWHQLYKGNL